MDEGGGVPSTHSSCSYDTPVLSFLSKINMIALVSRNDYLRVGFHVHCTLHNVYIGQYDSPVSEIAL